MLSYFLQLQQVLDAFIIFTAQQAETYSTSQNIELPSVQSSGNASSLKLPLMQFSPSNIRIAPFPTREYTDDEFQSIIKKVMGVLYVLLEFYVLKIIAL
jgi:ATP-binding cassette subfamily A (ABC1) protein 3